MGLGCISKKSSVQAVEICAKLIEISGKM